MQATHYDFNNYLPVFQNMLTSFKAPASSVNTTTLAGKIAPMVNQTTIEKTSVPLVNGTGGSSNLNRFHIPIPLHFSSLRQILLVFITDLITKLEGKMQFL
jgi:hypothetical protein